MPGVGAGRTGGAMEGKLRNMTSVYITKAGKMLLLFRQGSRVVNDVWTGSAGGHFEECELNDARACVLREMVCVFRTFGPGNAVYR